MLWTILYVVAIELLQNTRGGQCNPFPTNVYYLGNLVREQFLMVGLTYLYLFPSSRNAIEVQRLRVHAGAS